MSSTSPSRRVRVYPRVCGGTRRRGRAGLPLRGLSPRVRGNQNRQPFPLAIAGSIPACAGEPAPGVIELPVSRVYPRVCGGTSLRLASCGWQRGLSPRVRGNPPDPDWKNNKARSIPACAGEPSKVCSSVGISSVYPRVCGGTWLEEKRGFVCLGLSPRVRGNRRNAMHKAAALRSIPACAGEPYRWGTGRRCGAVYPRVCGGTGKAQRQA